MSSNKKKFTFVVTNTKDQGTWTTRREEIWSQINTHVAYAAHNKRAIEEQRPRNARRKSSTTGRSRSKVQGTDSTLALPSRNINISGDLGPDPYAPLEELVDLLEDRDHVQQREPIQRQALENNDEPRQERHPSKGRRSSMKAATRGKTSSTSNELSQVPTMAPTPLHNNYARFDRNRREDFNPMIMSMHHESIQQTWCMLLPTDPSKDMDWLEHTLLGFESHSDAFYYCSLYVSSVQYRVRRRDTQIPAHVDWTCLKLRAQALRHLQLEIDALQGRPVPDVILASIVALAAQEPHVYSQPHWKTARNESPLEPYQALNLVRHMRPLIAHVMAMYSMVGQRGGVARIDSFGLSHLLALNDLIAANGTAGTPRFPLFWSSMVHPDSTLSGDTTLLLKFGTNFYKTPIITQRHIQPLLAILPAIKEVTLALAHEQHNRLKPLDRRRIRELMETANSVHYRILSLHHPPDSQQDPSVLEAFRLATAIYSNLTIFPLGLQSGVPATLAYHLKEVFEAERPHSLLLEKSQPLILWVMVMGAIGSLEDLKLNVWFIDQLKPLVKTMCNNEIAQVIDHLHGFLWWDYVFASYLEDVWSLLAPRPSK